jgi:hypothetical protein
VGDFTTTPSAYASLRRDTPSPAKGTLMDGIGARIIRIGFIQWGFDATARNKYNHKKK